MEGKSHRVWTMLIVMVGTVLGVGVYLAAAQMGSPYIPKDKVMAMKQMMMSMPPQTLEESLDRGKKLYNDTTLGMNKSGQSCASCDSEGGTILRFGMKRALL